jgi:hypothetical protein
MSCKNCFRWLLQVWLAARGGGGPVKNSRCQQRQKFPIEIAANLPFTSTPKKRERSLMRDWRQRKKIWRRGRRNDSKSHRAEMASHADWCTYAAAAHSLLEPTDQWLFGQFWILHLLLKFTHLEAKRKNSHCFFLSVWQPCRSATSQQSFHEMKEKIGKFKRTNRGGDQEAAISLDICWKSAFERRRKKSLSGNAASVSCMSTFTSAGYKKAKNEYSDGIQVTWLIFRDIDWIIVLLIVGGLTYWLHPDRWAWIERPLPPCPPPDTHRSRCRRRASSPSAARTSPFRARETQWRGRQGCWSSCWERGAEESGKCRAARIPETEKYKVKLSTRGFFSILLHK